MRAETLILELMADTSQLTRDVNAAIDNAAKKVKGLEDSVITVKAPLKYLQDLNKELDLKERHIKQVANVAKSTPIVVGVDTRQVKSARKELADLRGEIGGSTTNKIFIKVEHEYKINARESNRDVSNSVQGLKGELKDIVKAVNSTKQGIVGRVFGGVLNAVTATPASIARGAFEGIGRSLSDNIGKGITSEFEKALSGRFGSSNAIGKVFASKLVDQLLNGIDSVSEFIEDELSKEVSVRENKKGGAKRKPSLKERVLVAAKEAKDSFTQVGIDYVPENVRVEESRIAAYEEEKRVRNARTKAKKGLYSQYTSQSRVSGMVTKLDSIDSKYEETESIARKRIAELNKQIADNDLQLVKLEDSLTQLMKAGDKSGASSVANTIKDIRLATESSIKELEDMIPRVQELATIKNQEILKAIESSSLSDSELREVDRIRSRDSSIRPISKKIGEIDSFIEKMEQKKESARTKLQALELMPSLDSSVKKSLEMRILELDDQIKQLEGKSLTGKPGLMLSKQYKAIDKEIAGYQSELDSLIDEIGRKVIEDRPKEQMIIEEQQRKLKELNEIKKRFRQPLAIAHPDRGGSTKRFQAVSEEYQKALYEWAVLNGESANKNDSAGQTIKSLQESINERIAVARDRQNIAKVVSEQPNIIALQKKIADLQSEKDSLRPMTPAISQEEVDLIDKKIAELQVSRNSLFSELQLAVNNENEKQMLELLIEEADKQILNASKQRQKLGQKKERLSENRSQFDSAYAKTASDVESDKIPVAVKMILEKLTGKIPETTASIPKIVIDDQLLSESKAGAMHLPASNQIAVKSDLYDRLVNNTLTQKDIENLTHEFQHNIDHAQGSAEGMYARNQGTIVGKKVAPVSPEMDRMARKKATLYHPDQRDYEYNAILSSYQNAPSIHGGYAQDVAHRKLYDIAKGGGQNIIEGLKSLAEIDGQLWDVFADILGVNLPDRTNNVDGFNSEIDKIVANLDGLMEFKQSIRQGLKILFDKAEQAYVEDMPSDFVELVADSLIKQFQGLGDFVATFQSERERIYEELSVLDPNRFAKPQSPSEVTIPKNDGRHIYPKAPDPWGDSQSYNQSRFAKWENPSIVMERHRRTGKAIIEQQIEGLTNLQKMIEEQPMITAEMKVNLFQKLRERVVSLIADPWNNQENNSSFDSSVLPPLPSKMGLLDYWDDEPQGAIALEGRNVKALQGEATGMIPFVEGDVTDVTSALSRQSSGKLGRKTKTEKGGSLAVQQEVLTTTRRIGVVDDLAETLYGLEEVREKIVKKFERVTGNVKQGILPDEAELLFEQTLKLVDDLADVNKEIQEIGAKIESRLKVFDDHKANIASIETDLDNAFNLDDFTLLQQAKRRISEQIKAIRNDDSLDENVKKALVSEYKDAAKKARIDQKYMSPPTAKEMLLNPLQTIATAKDMMIEGVNSIQNAAGEFTNQLISTVEDELVYAINEGAALIKRAKDNPLAFVQEAATTALEGTQAVGGALLHGANQGVRAIAPAAAGAYGIARGAEKALFSFSNVGPVNVLEVVKALIQAGGGAALLHQTPVIGELFQLLGGSAGHLAAQGTNIELANALLHAPPQLGAGANLLQQAGNMAATQAVNAANTAALPVIQAVTETVAGVTSTAVEFVAEVIALLTAGKLTVEKAHEMLIEPQTQKVLEAQKPLMLQAEVLAEKATQKQFSSYIDKARNLPEYVASLPASQQDIAKRFIPIVASFQQGYRGALPGQQLAEVELDLTKIKSPKDVAKLGKEALEKTKEAIESQYRVAATALEELKERMATMTPDDRRGIAADLKLQLQNRVKNLQKKAEYVGLRTESIKIEKPNIDVPTVDVGAVDVTNIANLKRTAKQTGKDTVQGAVEGAREMEPVYVEVVGDVFEKGNENVRKINEIASPSKLWKRFAKWLGLGAILGLKEIEPEVAKAAESVARASQPKMERDHLGLPKLPPLIAVPVLNQELVEKTDRDSHFAIRNWFDSNQSTGNKELDSVLKRLRDNASKIDEALIEVAFQAARDIQKATQLGNQQLIERNIDIIKDAELTLRKAELDDVRSDTESGNLVRNSQKRLQTMVDHYGLDPSVSAPSSQETQTLLDSIAQKEKELNKLLDLYDQAEELMLSGYSKDDALRIVSQQDIDVVSELKDDLKQAGDFAGGVFNKLREQFPIIDQAINKFKEIKNLIVNIGLAGAGAIGLFVIGKALTNIAVESVKVYRNFESIFIASKTIANGSEFLGKVRNQVKALGGDLETAMRQGQQFVTGLQGTTLERKAEDLFLGADQALKSLGLQTQQYDSAILAIKQVASKGRVSLEEISGQLGESVPGALNIAAQAMQTNVQGFIQLVESGNLLSEEFLPKFVERLKSQTAFLQPEVEKSLNASIGRLGANTTDLQVNIGASLSPMVVPTVNLLSNGLDTLNKNFDKAVIAAEMLAVALALPAAKMGLELAVNGVRALLPNLIVAKTAADALSQSLMIAKGLATVSIYLAGTAVIVGAIDLAMTTWKRGSSEVRDITEQIDSRLKSIAERYKKINDEAKKSGRSSSWFGAFTDDAFIGRINDVIQRMNNAQSLANKLNNADPNKGMIPLFPTWGDQEQQWKEEDIQKALDSLSKGLTLAVNLSDGDKIENYISQVTELQDKIAINRARITNLRAIDPVGNAKQIKDLENSVYATNGLIDQLEKMNYDFVPGGEAGLEGQVKEAESLRDVLIELKKRGFDFGNALLEVDKYIAQGTKNLEKMRDINNQLASSVNNQRLAWIDLNAQLAKAEETLQFKQIDNKLPIIQQQIDGRLGSTLAAYKMAQVEVKNQQANIDKLLQDQKARENFLKNKLETNAKTTVFELIGKSLDKINQGDIRKINDILGSNQRIPQAISEQIVGTLQEYQNTKLSIRQAQESLLNAKLGVIQQARTVEDFNRNLSYSIRDFNRGIESRNSEIRGIYRDWQRTLDDTVYDNQLTVRRLGEAYQDLMFNMESQLETSRNELLNLTDQINSEKRKQASLSITPGIDSYAKQLDSIFSQLFDSLTNGESEKRQANLEAVQTQKQYIDSLRQIRDIQEQEYQARKDQIRKIEDLNGQYSQLIRQVQDMYIKGNQERDDFIRTNKREGYDVTKQLAPSPNFANNQRSQAGTVHPMIIYQNGQTIRNLPAQNPVNNVVPFPSNSRPTIQSQAPVKPVDLGNIDSTSSDWQSYYWQQKIKKQLPPAPKVNQAIASNLNSQLQQRAKELQSLSKPSVIPTVSVSIPKKVQFGRASISHEELIALQQTAMRLGMPLATLLTIMLFETKGTLNPSIQNSKGATGLIQFMPATAKRLGTTVNALKKMSFQEQLPYVEKYFKLHGWQAGMSDLEAYATVLGGNPRNINSKDSNGTNALSGMQRMNRQHRPIADNIMQHFGILSASPAFNFGIPESIEVGKTAGLLDSLGRFLTNDMNNLKKVGGMFRIDEIKNMILDNINKAGNQRLNSPTHGTPMSQWSMFQLMRDYVIKNAGVDGKVDNIDSEIKNLVHHKGSLRQGFITHLKTLVKQGQIDAKTVDAYIKQYEDLNKEVTQKVNKAKPKAQPKINRPLKAAEYLNIFFQAHGLDWNLINEGMVDALANGQVGKKFKMPKGFPLQQQHFENYLKLPETEQARLLLEAQSKRRGKIDDPILVREKTAKTSPTATAPIIKQNESVTAIKEGVKEALSPAPMAIASITAQNFTPEKIVEFNPNLPKVPKLQEIPLSDYDALKERADAQKSANESITNQKLILAQTKQDTAYLQTINDLQKMIYSLQDANRNKLRGAYDMRLEIASMVSNAKGYLTAAEQNFKVGSDMFRQIEDKRRQLADMRLDESRKQADWDKEKAILVERIESNDQLTLDQKQQAIQRIANLDTLIKESQELQKYHDTQLDILNADNNRMIQLARIKDAEIQRNNAIKEYADITASLATARYNIGGELINNGTVISAKMNALVNAYEFKEKLKTLNLSTTQMDEMVKMQKELSDINIAQSYVDAIPFLKEFSTGLKDAILQTTTWNDALKKLLDLVAGTILDQMVIKPIQLGIANILNDWGIFGNTEPINPPALDTNSVFSQAPFNEFGAVDYSGIVSGSQALVQSIQSVNTVIPDLGTAFVEQTLTTTQNTITEQTALMTFVSALTQASAAVLGFSATLGGRMFGSFNPVSEGLLSGFTGDTLMLPTFANGVDNAMKKERNLSGKSPFLAVLHEGEAVLSTLNGDAQLWRALKANGDWNHLKADNPKNFAFGSEVKPVRTTTVKSGDNVQISMVVNASNADSFRKSERRILSDMEAQIKRNRR